MTLKDLAAKVHALPEPDCRGDDWSHVRRTAVIALIVQARSGAGLDVERLARVIGYLNETRPSLFRGSAGYYGQEESLAAAIAHEYDAEKGAAT